MSELITREGTLPRFKRMIDAFYALSDDGDLDFRIGKTETAPAIVLTIGPHDFPFVEGEAQIAIEILRGTVEKFGKIARQEGIHNLLRGFETALAEARRAYDATPAPHKPPG